MAIETKKPETSGKVGEVSTSPKAMQANKPAPEPIQAKPKLSPEEQSRLNKELPAALENTYRSRHTAEEYELHEKEYKQRVISLIEAGATVETDGSTRMRHQDLDYLMEILLKVEFEHKRSLFPGAILDIAKAFIADSASFQGWSHSVCHNFERYWGTWTREGSLLNLKENQAAAEMLINDAVRRAISEQKYGNMGRILDPLLRYNMDNAETFTSGAFPFKPKSIENPEFIAVIRKPSEGKDYCAANRAFCESRSLEELIPKMAQISKSEELKHHYSGLYVDVAGTLISSDGQLNQKVLGKMREARAAGVKVTVFTGGSPEEAKEILLRLGVEEEFLSVDPKGDYLGEKLGTVIDDSPPESQGFAANSWVKPEEL